MEGKPAFSRLLTRMWRLSLCQTEVNLSVLTWSQVNSTKKIHRRC